MLNPFSNESSIPRLQEEGSERTAGFGRAWGVWSGNPKACATSDMIVPHGMLDNAAGSRPLPTALLPIPSVKK